MGNKNSKKKKLQKEKAAQWEKLQKVYPDYDQQILQQTQYVKHIDNNISKPKNVKTNINNIKLTPTSDNNSNNDQKAQSDAIDNNIDITAVSDDNNDKQINPVQDVNEPVALNTDNKSKNMFKKSDSAYYLYKSTDKKEAQKYKPKKLDKLTTKQIENQIASKSKGSSWNTGATMEQFDYSEWMKKRIKSLLLGITFNNNLIKIYEIVKIDGSATILLVRRKYRIGYDISFECKWKGYINDNDDNQCNGTLKMIDIAPEDDADDWEYEVNIDENTDANKLGLDIVRKNKEVVIDALNIFIKELRDKKT